MIDIYILADDRTTPEAVASIPHLVGKPRGITLYTRRQNRRGYAIACWREDFGAVKRALSAVCDAAIYNFGTWSNAHVIDFRSLTDRDTGTRMIIAEESAPRGIVFDKSCLRYTFTKA